MSTKSARCVLNVSVTLVPLAVAAPVPLVPGSGPRVKDVTAPTVLTAATAVFAAIPVPETDSPTAIFALESQVTVVDPSVVSQVASVNVNSC